MPDTPVRRRRQRPEPKPLHDSSYGDRAFQHPVSGCAWQVDDRTYKVYVRDLGQGSDEARDAVVYDRYELGAWLARTQPDESLYLVHQGYIDALYPVSFDLDTPEGKVMHGRIDMATSVMEAGGACTLCEAEPGEEPPHRLGCELISLLLHLATKPDEADENSLAAVIRRANEQIARMA